MITQGTIFTAPNWNPHHVYEIIFIDDFLCDEVQVKVTNAGKHCHVETWDYEETLEGFYSGKYVKSEILSTG